MRDIIKLAAENAVTWVKKSDLSAEIFQSEQSLNENKYSYVYEPSEYHYGLFVAKLDDMFLLASARHICVRQRDTNMASPFKALYI